MKKFSNSNESGQPKHNDKKILHIELPASGANTWANCTPSARLGSFCNNTGINYGVEGTEAHKLSEYTLRQMLDMEANDPTETMTMLSNEMYNCAVSYAEYIFEQMKAAKQTCPDAAIYIEQPVDFTRWVRTGFGIVDCIIVANGVLHIIDYKYGQGIRVSAEGNPQMMCYALGALELLYATHDIDSVLITVYQPRCDNYSTCELSIEELYRWAEESLKPNADLAFLGDGKYLCGEWCANCIAKYNCRNRANVYMEPANYEFKQGPLLTDEEIENILSIAGGLSQWISDIVKYAIERAINGKTWNGWKLVESSSMRKYTDENAVAKAVIGAGFNPYKSNLKSIPEMEKEMGKKCFNETLSTYIEKPKGKLILVKSTDKRPAVSTAASDFEIKGE